MKKLLLMTVLLICTLANAGCGGVSQAEFDRLSSENESLRSALEDKVNRRVDSEESRESQSQQETSSVALTAQSTNNYSSPVKLSYHNITLLKEKNWIDIAEDDLLYLYFDNSDFFFLQYGTPVDEVFSEDVFAQFFFDSFVSAYDERSELSNLQYSGYQEKEVSGIKGNMAELSMDFHNGNGTASSSICVFLFPYNGDYYVGNLSIQSGQYEETYALFEKIISSIEPAEAGATPDDASVASNTSQSSQAESSNTAASSESTSPSAPSTEPTKGQRNALTRAKEYLNVMPFSYEGLMDQLEYEGYSHEEAVYGADHCGADWYEQAALKAEKYLELMSFSRSRLIDQLEYDGFTNAQAVHGAEANGY